MGWGELYSFLGGYYFEVGQRENRESVFKRI